METVVDGFDLDQYHLLHTTRAALLRRLDRRDETIVSGPRGTSQLVG